MSTRSIILGVALLFIGFLAFLTISVAVERGFDALVGLSLLVLALLGFGVLGALTTPPDE